ncbi:MAG TPA: S8 family peptidase, partial [Vicinamibacterales bacterium]|nr:S8 family peptidase [Vicinamibacterales bacterium]
MIELPRLFARRISGPALILSLALSPAVVEAGPHRARLSQDLEARLAAGSTGATSVIISGTETAIRSVAQRYGATVTKSLRGGAVLEVTAGQLDALTSDPDVTHLSGDARVQRMTATTTEATGAPQVWTGIAGLRGFSGQGVGVAVIDSGVAGEHSALRRHLLDALDFTGKKGTAADRFGHGTHVAGIIAGTDDAGEYSGLAPGAHIVSLKVLGPDGSGDTSDVINAIDWAIEHKASHALRVINLSLGRPVFESYREDPLCHAVQRAVDAGLVVVAAAGNMGKTVDGRPMVGAVMAPGSCPSSLTVGALNTGTTVQRSDDVVATYSSRGPTAIDGLLKPDVVAPGNKIVAAAAPGSFLVQSYPDRIVAGQGANAYIQFSGTSMAAAEVSGVTALLLEANPSLTPADVKLLLQVTSSPVSGAGLIEAGAGSINA